MNTIVGATRSTGSVFEYFLTNYRKTWRGSAFTFFLMPLLILLGMGVGVGRYVDGGAAAHLGGVTYLAYLAPGMLATTAVQVGIGESTHPVYGALHWNRIYHTMRMSPLTTTQILTGHLAYLTFRIGLSASAFLLVMTAFGTVDSPMALLALPAATLAGLAVAPLVFTFSATADDPVYLETTYRVLTIPMSLFSGVFFPVSQMPHAAQLVAYALPLWHGVELCRAATAGTSPAWGVPAHVGYLGLWMACGFLLARRAFARRLTD